MKPSLAVALVVASIALAPAATAVAGDGDSPPPATSRDPAKLAAELASPDLTLRRKAAYALWQAGNAAPEATLPLARAMLDADAYVRTTAAKALSRHFDLGPAKTALSEALSKGAPDVRLDAVKLLQRVGLDDRPVGALAAALADADPEVRANAAAALEWTGGAGKPASAALLRCVTDDEDPRVRSWAARALGSIDGAQLVAPLVERLASDEPAVRAEAAALLGCGGAGAAGAARPLARLLTDEDPAIRAAAAAGLGAGGPGPEIERLLPALDDPAPEVRTAALAAMNQPGTAGMEKALPRLAKLLASEDAAVRAGATVAIASIDPAPHAPALAAIVRSDPDASVRQSAMFGLSSAGPLLPDAEIPTVVKALGDADAVVRNVAASLLLQLGRRASAAVPAVLRAAGEENDAFARQWALMALPRLGVDATTALPLLRKALGAEAPFLRSAAVQTLGEYGADAAGEAPALAALVADGGDATVRSAAALALGKIGPPAKQAAAVLRTVPVDAPYLVRVHAAYALAAVSPDDAAASVTKLVGWIGGDPSFGVVPVTHLGLLGPAARPAEAPLLALLRKRERASWSAAALAVCRIGGDGAKEALDVLLAAARDVAPERASDRAGAFFALAELPQCAEASVPVLVRALGDADIGFRSFAIRALTTLGPAAAKAVPDLEKASKDHAPAIRRAAEAALLRVRG